MQQPKLALPELKAMDVVDGILPGVPLNVRHRVVLHEPSDDPYLWKATPLCNWGCGLVWQVDRGIDPETAPSQVCPTCHRYHATTQVA